MAYVPQAGNSYFAFAVREVVLMGRTAHLGLFAAPGAKDLAAADAALAELNIAHLADKPFTHISGGERQLVLIARALAQESPLLVMDEPTASLDFGNQALMLNEILRLRASGRSVLFCSHDPDHALRCADRALLLHQGNVLALGAPREVVTAANLQVLYGVEVQLIERARPRLLPAGAAIANHHCRLNRPTLINLLETPHALPADLTVAAATPRPRALPQVAPAACQPRTSAAKSCWPARGQSADGAVLVFWIAESEILRGGSVRDQRRGDQLASARVDHGGGGQSSLRGSGDVAGWLCEQHGCAGSGRAMPPSQPGNPRFPRIRRGRRSSLGLPKLKCCRQPDI
jgi:ABC-type cobalamin/Fe3+-siderophores transport system ATPase subunit